ncbi:MAG: protein kinase [Anaerolineae bacterium]|nr:protein kinase [Anaerolineae bacterium]
MQTLHNQTLDGTYRIDCLLGSGGMGAVYRAHDLSLERDVAIKVMHAHLSNATFRARFVQEARAIANLDHPGIVRVHAFGQDLGQLYIVMDFVPGQALSAWLERLRTESKIVALAESLRIAHQVALALHYAHEKGVLHRDIKPSNIMLKPTDPSLQEDADLPFHPVLTDFGLAKLAEGGVQTQAGTTMGSPAYMSPEQCRGDEPDRRSDIYSLGILLYELATGRVPFEPRTLTQAIHLHTQEPPPPPRSINPSLPVEVEQIILCALAKDKQARFPTARAMAEALRDAISTAAGTATVAPPQGGEGAGPYVSLMTRLAEESAAPAPPDSDVWRAAPPGPQGGATLIVVSPDGRSRRVMLADSGTATIGRSPANDVQLDDTAVSRHHARVAFDGQSVTATDLNSTNGTYLDDARLLPGIAHPWPAGRSLRVGAHWLRYEAPAGAAPSVLDGAPAGRRSSTPQVALDPELLTVEAGQRAMAWVRVLNRGAQVDHFSLGVDGIPPSWVTLPPEPLRLTPHEEGAVKLIVHPPRDPQSGAGAHPFTLRAISLADPRQFATASCMLEIPPFHEVAAELAPQQVSGGWARLELANRGNAETSLSIRGTDPAEALQIQAQPPQVTLQAGQDQAVTIEARARQRRPLVGATQRYPFELLISSPAGQALRQWGTLIVRPILPSWVLPVLGVLLLLILSGAGVVYKRWTDQVRATQTASAATAIAAVTLTAVTDTDGDGLPDLEELRLGADPRNPDTDGDGLKDGDEVLIHRTDLLNPDTDRDGLNDGDEIAYKADPFAIDSDGDTLSDGVEVHEMGTSPINPDTDSDGLNDNVDPDPGQLPTPTPPPTDVPTATETPPPTPTSGPAQGPAMARDAALAYLAAHGGESPPAGTDWNEENITPAGLVGGTTIRYTAQDWTVTVSYPVVLPEYVVYRVHVVGDAAGIDWEGQVDAAGTVSEAPAPAPCEAVANQEVWIYARPPVTELLSTTVEIFGKMPAGTRVTVEARTANGWLGFDPGVAQAANVGVFRLRWLDPRDPLTVDGDCGALPEVVGPVPGVCYTMPMEETRVYQSPDTASTVLTTLNWGDYVAVLGQMPDTDGDGMPEWVQVDLSVGSVGLDQQGWVEASTLNLNGDRCSYLPVVAP